MKAYAVAAALVAVAIGLGAAGEAEAQVKSSIVPGFTVSAVAKTFYEKRGFLYEVFGHLKGAFDFRVAALPDACCQPLFMVSDMMDIAHQRSAPTSKAGAGA